MSRDSATKPDEPAVEHFHRGNRLMAEGRIAEAAAAFGEALVLHPGFAEAALNLGLMLERTGRCDEARSFYERAALARPDLPEAHLNFGNASFKTGRFSEAAAAFRRTLALRPHLAAAWLNLGNALRCQNDFDGAAAAYARLLVLQPDSVDVQVNLTNLFRAQNRLEEARASAGRALALAPGLPQAHVNLAMVHLVAGELEAGWPHAEYRQVLKLGGAGRELPQPQWRGDASLAGRTILLHAEQGFGDTLQFVRYAPLVAALAAKVHLEVQPALLPLLGSMPGMTSVFSSGDSLPEFELHCPLPSLPLAFATELAGIPARVPYVRAPEARVTGWREWLGSKTVPRVGLVWSGNPTHPNDFNRSIPLAQFLPVLGGIRGARFVSLQKNIPAADATLLATMPEVAVAAERLGDFADTAALIGQLDLVITVDTAVAHLAGALGRPVWVLLPFSPDWRWLLERDDSPWYPTARLFRQATTGDWEPVIRRVREELQWRFEGK